MTPNNQRGMTGEVTHYGVENKYLLIRNGIGAVWLASTQIKMKRNDNKNILLHLQKALVYWVYITKWRYPFLSLMRLKGLDVVSFTLARQEGADNVVLNFIIISVRPKSATQKAIEDRVFSIATKQHIESDESDG